MGRLIELLRRNRTVAISAAAAILVIAAAVAIPLVGGDDDDDVEVSEPRGGPGVDGGDGTTTTAAVDGATTTVAAGADTGDPSVGDGAGEDGAPGDGAGTGGGGTAPRVTAPRATAPPGPVGVTRGVSGNKIRIGVAYPDLSAFGRISENFNVGDQRQQMEAVLDGWRKSRLVPVHGRDVEFVYRDFDLFSSEEKVAVCQDLVEDEKVFAVVTTRFFGEGAECVARRFKTPLITVPSELSSLYQRTSPWLFSVRPPYERLFRNWMRWADEGGRLRGKKIGLFYESEVEAAVKTGIKDELAKRGYKITEEVSAEGAGVGTSQDQSAVVRFRNAGVNLVIPVVGGTSLINFMTFAESQQYRPTYIDSDYGEHATDAAASVYPAAQYDKTFAMTTTRIGEIAARMKLPAETTTCVSNYERFSGKRIGHKSPETAEYNSIVVSCDAANTLLRGLQVTGRGLGQTSLVRGLESARNVPMAAHGSLSFAPGRHYGLTSYRTVQWTGGCKCWRASGGFTPFAV